MLELQLQILRLKIQPLNNPIYIIDDNIARNCAPGYRFQIFDMYK